MTRTKSELDEAFAQFQAKDFHLDKYVEFAYQARRYRTKRTPPPLPPAGHRSWLRGRRRDPAALLALHHAAVLVRFGWWRGWKLALRSTFHFGMWTSGRWRPCEDTFLAWLVHHDIVEKRGHGYVSKGPAAEAFAKVPSRNRVALIGRLILDREGVPMDKLATSGGPKVAVRKVPVRRLDRDDPRGPSYFIGLKRAHSPAAHRQARRQRKEARDLELELIIRELTFLRQRREKEAGSGY